MASHPPAKMKSVRTPEPAAAGKGFGVDLVLAFQISNYKPGVPRTHAFDFARDGVEVTRLPILSPVACRRSRRVVDGLLLFPSCPSWLACFVPFSVPCCL